jgi:hypothetical protein
LLVLEFELRASKLLGRPSTTLRQYIRPPQILGKIWTSGESSHLEPQRSDVREIFPVPGADASPSLTPVLPHLLLFVVLGLELGAFTLKHSTSRFL